jgi:hypothetical protein
MSMGGSLPSRPDRKRVYLAVNQWQIVVLALQGGISLFGTMVSVRNLNPLTR